MSWLTAEANPCNHALLLDCCLSRLLISQVIPYDFLVYLSHSKEIKCAFRFIAESGLQAEGPTRCNSGFILYGNLHATQRNS